MMEGDEFCVADEDEGEFVAEDFEWRDFVSSDPVVDAPSREGPGPARLCVVDCVIEGELRVPAGYSYVNVVRGSIGRLVVAAQGVIGVHGSECAVGEVVLGCMAARRWRRWTSRGAG